jgi:hypothetical protein
MSQGDLAQLADAWIRYWRLPEESPEREALFWATEREWELLREDPDSAWFLVLEVLRRDSSDQIIEVLSAGPLEDLLARHGPYVIARVEAEAKSSPEFASLLGGVWRNTMSQEIWDRVQAVWDRKGWDGNAA